MKFFTVKRILQYYLPVTLTLFMVVTIERTVLTDGGYDRLYGLPLPYISSSYAFSFHYDVYLVAMALDLISYLLITACIFKMLEKLRLPLKIHLPLILFGMIVTLLWITVFVLKTAESSFELQNNVPHTTVGKKLIFGTKP